MIIPPTLSISSNSGIISQDYFPSIKLDGIYEIGLQLLQTFHSVPNIDETNNKFYYKETSENSEWKIITIPVGSYELSAIHTYLQENLGDPNVNKDDPSYQVFGKRVDPNEQINYLEIIPNVNTLTCSIKSTVTIDFRQKYSLWKVFGFERKLLNANVFHHSSQPVDILKVTTISLDCNIATGSYKNGSPVHTIYEFTPSVPPGNLIIERPVNMIYYPLNTGEITNVTLKLLDQHRQLIYNRSELLTVVLHLRKVV